MMSVALCTSHNQVLFCGIYRKKLDLLSEKEMETLESALCASEGFGSVVCENKETMPTIEGTSPSFSSVIDNPGQCSSLGISHLPEEAPLIADEERNPHCSRPSNILTEGDLKEPTKPQGEKLTITPQDPGDDSGDDELQRLFIGICGIADKMQAKFSKEMRMVLKHVFFACQNDDDDDETLDSSSTAEEKEPSSEQLGHFAIWVFLPCAYICIVYFGVSVIISIMVLSLFFHFRVPASSSVQSSCAK